MTNETMKKGSRSIIALIAVFVMSAALLFVTACTGGKDSSTSSSDSSSGASTATVTDTHVLLNGNFEYYAEGDSVTFPYSSSIKWSNSRGYIVSASSSDYAPSSTGKSGIISTGDEAYAKLLETKFGSTDDTLETYLKGDNAAAFNPHSPSYYGYTEKDADVPESSDNDRVLMIHNRVSGSEGQGTAQYFYSSGSTLSLAAGEYGKLSVWVNTYGLATEMKTNEYGAYVKVVNKAGSTDLSPLFVKNINTNGQWVKVEIYLEASKLSSSTYTLYLGLGLGSANVRAEYAEGFAFFDDVTFETLEKDEYAAAGVPAGNVYDSFTADATTELTDIDDEDINASLAGATYTANNKEDNASYSVLKYSLSNAALLTRPAGLFTVDAADIKLNGEAFANAGHKAEAQGALSSSVKFAAKSALTLSDEKAFLGADDEVLFADADEFLCFDFGSTPSSVKVTMGTMTLDKDERILFTFWAKTKVDLRSAKGLTVTVRDRGAAGVAEDDYKTTDVIASLTEINSENNGWKQYSVIINNTAKEIDGATGIEKDEAVTRYFDLVINFGPTDNLVNDKSEFPKGYALVGDFEYAYVSEEAASVFNVNNTVSLSAEIVNTKTESDGTYSLSGRKGQIESAQLTQPLSVIQAYGTNYANSGIFNSKYYTDDKAINGVSMALINALEKDAGNDSLQALAIGDAIGYYTDKYTVSANSLAKVTVKLAVFGGATAHVNVLDRTKTPTGTRGYDILALSKDDIKTENLVSGSLENDIVYSYEVSGSAKEGKWITVTFYVQAGTESIDFSVEVGNYTDRADMWDATKTANGVVIVNSVSVSTSDTATVSSLEDEAELNGATSETVTFAYRTDSYDIDNKDTRVTTEIAGETENVTKVTDGDLYFTSESADGYVLYANYLATNFEDKVYVTVSTGDETDDSTSTSDTSSSDNSDALPVEARWLYISSIVIALALIVVLAIIIVRYFVKKSRAKRVKTVSYYDKDARDRANEKIRANKAKRAALEAENTEPEVSDEEPDEYDYDAAANIDETEVSAEETEVTEEVTDDAAEEVTEEAPVEEAAPAVEETPAEAPAEVTAEPAQETPAEPAPVAEETPSETTETPAEPAEEKKED
ncbi:MAG: hypothetical protein IJR61_02545 [Clostridia bacterium]|nr:hypothetical protein [Clostridia bacterium]